MVFDVQCTNKFYGYSSHLMYLLTVLCFAQKACLKVFPFGLK
jgi:hypothetical protein